MTGSASYNEVKCNEPVNRPFTRASVEHYIVPVGLVG